MDYNLDLMEKENKPKVLAPVFQGANQEREFTTEQGADALRKGFKPKFEI